MGKFSYSVIDSNTDTHPAGISGDFTGFIQHLKTHTRLVPLTGAEYHALDRDARAQAKNGPAFLTCTFTDGSSRRQDAVQAVHGLVLDIDKGNLDAKTIQKKLTKTRHILYETLSSKPEARKWRVVIPYTRPVTPAEHEKVFAAVAALFPAESVDPRGRLANQLWYGIQRLKDQRTPSLREGHGVELDPEKLNGSHRLKTITDPDAAVSEGERNSTLNAYVFREAFKAQSEEQLLALAAEKNSTYAPPLSDKEVRQLVTRAWRQVNTEEKYKKQRTKMQTRAQQSEAGQEQEQKTEAEPEFKFGNYNDFISEPPPIWLVSNLIARRQVSVLYGPPNAGKSAFALMLACALSSGRFKGLADLQSWDDHLGVLYFAMEGALGPRLKALRAEGMFPPGAHPLHLERSITLPNEFELLDKLIGLSKTQCPSLGLIVIDTLARAAPGIDENTADLGQIAAKCGAIALAHDIHIMLIHHTGKDASRGARGHSSLKAAVDSEIEIQIDQDAEGRVLRRVMYVTKQRDGEAHWGRELLLGPVNLGQHPLRPQMQLSSVVAQIRAGAAHQIARAAVNRFAQGSPAAVVWPDIERGIAAGKLEWTAKELWAIVERYKGTDPHREERKHTARMVSQICKKRGAKFTAHGKDFWLGVLKFAPGNG